MELFCLLLLFFLHQLHTLVSQSILTKSERGKGQNDLNVWSTWWAGGVEEERIIGGVDDEQEEQSHFVCMG